MVFTSGSETITHNANNDSRVFDIDSLSNPRFVCDREADSLELVKFYNAMDGINWINKWNLNQSMNTWFGISLNSEGCVECITMGSLGCNSSGSNNLNGELFDINLPFLKRLLVSEPLTINTTDNLFGTIPDFSYLQNLEWLQLWGNFTGPIPDFSKLNSINNMSLNGLFTESIPDFSNISTVKALQIVGIFDGKIPDFQNLSQLTNLYIAGQQIGTTIFKGESIPAYHSNILGGIPDFSNLPNLDVLHLKGLSCAGQIPNFQNFPNLRFLIIENLLHLNSLLPNFNKLPNLLSLAILTSSITGEIPNFDFAPLLTNLTISNTFVIGHLPQFDKNPELQTIYFGYNNSDLPVPIYTNLPELKLLDLSGNQYTFEDILYSFEQNNSIIQNNKNGPLDSLYYEPQQSIFVDTVFIVNENDILIIDLIIDDTISTNIYQWMKNGIPFTSITGSNQLAFASIQIQDAGIYTVKITNPYAPLLTLNSYPIQVLVLPCDIIAEEILNAEASPGIVCPGYESIVLSATAISEALGYFWVLGWNGDTIISTSFNHIISVPETVEPGIYDICVRAYNNCGATAIPLCFEVAIVESPKENKTEAQICLDKFPLIWGTMTINEPGTFTQTFTNIDGCRQDSIWTIESKDCFGGVEDQPILLTPNGDNVNDVLIIEGIDAYPNNELIIVNRWGDVVYQAKAYMNNWGGEGSNGGLLTQGTYYFILRNVGAHLPQGGYIVILK